MQDETKRYQCRHIFTEGRRCGSPCLRHEELCYYHHTTRRPVENPRERRARQAHFDLPLPEDRASIQLSIGEVLRRIARNEIDPKRAGLLLYGLQIASLNLPRTTTTTANIAPVVEEIVADPKLGTLAPRAEVPQQQKPQTLVGALLEIIEQDRELEAADAAARAAAVEANKAAAEQASYPPETTEPETTQPTVLPNIQARATHLGMTTRKAIAPANARLKGAGYLVPSCEWAAVHLEFSCETRDSIRSASKA